jgi:hypothetical protein
MRRRAIGTLRAPRESGISRGDDMTASVQMPAHPGGMAHSTVREGIVAGLLGAAVIAGWFLIVDTIAGRPLHTPALLGAIVARAADPIVAADGANRLQYVALYTPIHCLLFALFGVVVMYLTHRAQRQPSILMLALILFVAFEGGFTGLVAILEQTALGDLAWYQVAIGNLVAVVVMGWYVLRRHPGMGRVWSHRLDDQG